jgi:hypothetical protein
MAEKSQMVKDWEATFNRPFFLMDQRPSVYDPTQGLGLACPECYRPVSRTQRDGRCFQCLGDKTVLPVNYRRPPKRKEEDEDEDTY